MKKLFIIIACILLIVYLGFVNNEVEDIGYSDKPIYWGYDNSVLYLSSKDNPKTPYSFMSDLDPKSYDEVPWFEYRDDIYKVIILDNKDKIMPISMAYWFGGMFNLCSIEGLNNINTSCVTNMEYLFSSSELIEIDLSTFDTGSVNNMRGLFFSCEELTTLDLSSFNTSNVKDMIGMFFNCKNLVNLDLYSFDTSKVEHFSDMFELCSKLERLDLSNFNTISATSMSYMFYSCKSLEYLDISSFDTSNVEFFDRIFGDPNDYIRNIDYSHFDFSKDRGFTADRYDDYNDYLYGVYDEVTY